MDLSRNFIFHFIHSGVIVLALSILLLSLSYLLMTQSSPDDVLEKFSPYECGFTPFEDTRSYFDLRFYIVCILFIVFDIELSLLFVWVVSAEQIGLQGHFVVFSLVGLLLLGFVFEVMVGALDFE